MDLVDQIERARFLGREWLLYLWYESERMGADDLEALREDATVPLERPPQELFTPPGVDPFALYVSSPLVLESRFDIVERVTIAGTEPSESAEARAALREGKLPAKLKVEIVRGEREWACTIDGDTLALSGVRLPAEMKNEDDDVLTERLYLLEELETMLDALLKQYVELRLSKRFKTHTRATMQEWVSTDLS
jgi:hypothetical protein